MTVVGAGVTLHEALTAADQLKGEGINIRVVDPFTLKPVDKDLLIASAKATGGLVVTVEDHYDQGKRLVQYIFSIPPKTRQLHVQHLMFCTLLYT